MAWHRVTIRYCHRGSPTGRRLKRVRVAAKCVEACATGVGADHQQGAVLAQVAVRYPGRDDDNVAGCELDFLAGRATEADYHAAGSDAQDLMRDAMEMVERVDAVPPGVAPPTDGKRTLDAAGVGQYGGAVE